MNKILQSLIAVLLVAALIYTGYQLGRQKGRGQLQTQLTENYSFVRDIAELASLEVGGTSQIRSSNVANDGSWTDAFRKMFTEQTIYLSVPYTAKYGVKLDDSLIEIQRKDTLVEVHLPAPRLLSLELHLDRMDAISREGFFSSINPEQYAAFHRQLYSACRAQLEQNQTHTNAAKESLQKIIVQYFQSFGLKAQCIFDIRSGVEVHRELAWL